MKKSVGEQEVRELWNMLNCENNALKERISFNKHIMKWLDRRLYGKEMEEETYG